MTRLTEMTLRTTYRQEEETTHLFDTETRKEMVLCGADASVYDLITVQYCLRQLIEGIRVANLCRTCMARATC